MRPRVIPSLLLDDGRFVKTVRFSDPVYVGDPVNVLSIFNHFEVDEILILGVSESRKGRPPPIELLEHLAAECTIPLSYGGGITSLEEAGRILGAGYEKVLVNSVAATRPEVVTAISERFGTQAVIGGVDARRGPGGTYTAWARSGTEPMGRSAADQAGRLQELGAGEIFVNSIDRDGTRDGYDTDLIRSVSSAVTTPVIACGGAGRRSDLALAINQGNASAAAAGSLFVFQGAGRGVLINFPSPPEL